MKSTIAILALLTCASAPATQAQIAPADVPVLLDLIVQTAGRELRRQDAKATGTGIFIDATSLLALRAAVPGLTSLPAQGRGYNTRSQGDVTRGASLRFSLVYPGENLGEHMVRVDPSFEGRRGHTMIFEVTKNGGLWKVNDFLVLVD